MKKNEVLFITETPRDAMQGISGYIPAFLKVEYLNLLLKCGFETLDVGSFVSPKAVPQMADTAQVLEMLDPSDTGIMVIAGNTKGCERAVAQSRVSVVGFPYSVSPTFLKKNINSTPVKAFETINELIEITHRNNRKLLVYLGMAFGNPYRDPWNTELLLSETEKLYRIGIRELSLSDITAEASPEIINDVCLVIQQAFPEMIFRLHLHTLSGNSPAKIDAAYHAGIRHFESAIGGVGGCPMTGYDMVSNLNTIDLLNYCKLHGIPTSIDENVIGKAETLARMIFA